MTQKRNLIIPYILLIITLGVNLFLFVNLKEKNLLLSKYKIQDNNLLSMMIEDENGEYKESIDNSWPSNDYILNKDRSGCENGGTLEYQDNNVYVKAKSSDRCYVYFDIDNIGNRCRGQELTSCLIANKSLDTTLIFHDGKADYDGMPNSNLEAEDNSYRYSGPDAEVNNYVCLDAMEHGECDNSDLYRIIGLFKNGDKYEAKLIKADYTTARETGKVGVGTATRIYQNVTNYYKNPENLPNIMSYSWSNLNSASISNNFATSDLNNINLNQIFYTYITTRNSSLAKLINLHNWYLAGTTLPNRNAKEVYKYELGLESFATNYPTEPKSINNFIGLMYVSDYMYGASPTYWSKPGNDFNNFDDYRQAVDFNWMYNGLYEHTIMRFYNDQTNFIAIAGIGILDVYGIVLGNSFAIRPVFYLVSTTKIQSGVGTKKNPYRIMP